MNVQKHNNTITCLKKKDLACSVVSFHVLFRVKIKKHNKQKTKRTAINHKLDKMKGAGEKDVWDKTGTEERELFAMMFEHDILTVRQCLESRPDWKRFEYNGFKSAVKRCATSVKRFSKAKTTKESVTINNNDDVDNNGDLNCKLIIYFTLTLNLIE
jgi:hypothetical protein